MAHYSGSEDQLSFVSSNQLLNLLAGREAAHLSVLQARNSCSMCTTVKLVPVISSLIATCLNPCDLSFIRSYLRQQRLGKIIACRTISTPYVTHARAHTHTPTLVHSILDYC